MGHSLRLVEKPETSRSRRKPPGFSKLECDVGGANSKEKAWQDLGELMCFVSKRVGFGRRMGLRLKESVGKNNSGFP